MTRRISLPPVVSGIANGNVVWKALEGVDYDMLGYFLSCHLILEHYVDEFLAGYASEPFAWEDARLTFTQKLALLSKDPTFSGPWNPLPTLKHMNGVRNKFAHDISARLTDKEILPFKQYIHALAEKKEKLPVKPLEILDHYTMLVAAYFGGAISRSAAARHRAPSA